MSRKSPPPIFLQRASYRQRRLRDAAKLMPFVGVILWALPLSWGQTGQDAPNGTAGLIYVFAVWVVLIILTAFLASRIRSDKSAADANTESGDT